MKGKNKRKCKTVRKRNQIPSVLLYLLKRNLPHFEFELLLQLKNVIDLRSSGSPFHVVVDAYLNECKPWVVLTQGTISVIDPRRSCVIVLIWYIPLRYLGIVLKTMVNISWQLVLYKWLQLISFKKSWQSRDFSLRTILGALLLCFSTFSLFLALQKCQTAEQCLKYGQFFFQIMATPSITLYKNDDFGGVFKVKYSQESLYMLSAHFSQWSTHSIPWHRQCTGLSSTVPHSFYRAKLLLLQTDILTLVCLFLFLFRFQKYTATQKDLSADFPSGARSARVDGGKWTGYTKPNFEAAHTSDLTEGNSYKNPDSMSITQPIFSIETK